MRTLKKALSLVLVLAMVFALAVPGFAADKKASDFTDYSKVTNKEAVDVLTAIGVLNGNTDGSFGADGTFTRAQAATMLAYLTLGKTVADALPTAATNFNDVPATFWGAKYIQYCADAGYISGYGNGKFGPDDTLTSTQWALMLLGALGYKAANEGIGGNGWEIATTRLAMQAGVASAEELTGTFNRDIAAKMAFNTLTADVVTYSGGSTVTVDGVTFTNGADRETVAQGNYKDYTLAATTDGKEATAQFCEVHFPTLKLTTGTVDAFQRPADHSWFIDKDNSGTYNAAKDTLAHNAMKAASFTATITAKTIKPDVEETVTGGAGADGDAKKAELAKNVNAILGLTKTAEKLTFDGVMSVNGVDDVAWADTDFLAGDEVEVYVDTNNVIKNIVVTRYTLVKVDTITALSAGTIKSNSTNADTDIVKATTNVKLVGTDGTTNKTLYNTKIAGFDYEKGTWILAAIDQNAALGSATKVLATKVAETLTGTIDATKSSTYRINGTYYAAGSDATVGINVTGTWALDAAGKLAADVSVTEVSGDYIYIYSIVKSATSDNGLSGASYTAYGVTGEGEQVSYPVATVAGTSTGTVYMAGKKDVLAYQLNTLGTGVNSVTLVTAYKVNAKGQIEATAGNATVQAVNSTNDVNKNSAVVGSSLYATNDTKFVFVSISGTTLKVTTATGYKNVNIDASSTGYYAVTDAAGKASFVFVSGAAAALDSSASATLAVKVATAPVYTKAADGTETYTYTFVVDGVEKEVAQTAVDSTVDDYSVGDVFVYTLDSTGDMSPAKTNVTTGTVAFVSGNQLQVGSATIDLDGVAQYTITVHSNSNYAEVAEGASYSTDSTADGYNVTYYTVNSVVKAVFVTNTVAD